MGLLYCLGVGCGFVGRVLVWPGGRRGCSEVGGETLVALQVGKGVKLAPLRKGVQTLWLRPCEIFATDSTVIVERLTIVADFEH